MRLGLRLRSSRQNYGQPSADIVFLYGACVPTAVKAKASESRCPCCRFVAARAKTAAFGLDCLPPLKRTPRRVCCANPPFKKAGSSKGAGILRTLQHSTPTPRGASRAANP